MPFTLSHAAAVLPLRRLPGCRSLPLTALVIGSLLPDFAFLLPGFSRDLSHSLPGLWQFCLPLGWVLQLLFWHGLQRPLLALFPRALERRLLCVLNAESRNLLPVSAALMAGAATHVLWDSFTHSGDWGTQLLPFLQQPIGFFGDRPLRLSGVLQHLSSLGGLLLITVHACRWYSRSTEAESRATLRRTCWWVLLLMVPLGTAFLALAAHLPGELLEPVVAWSAGMALKAGGLTLLLYALWWHWAHGQQRRQQGKRLMLKARRT